MGGRCILKWMAIMGAINLVMIVFTVAVLKGWFPLKPLAGFITGLHYTVGITTPTPQQIRRATAIWAVSILIIVDMLFALVRWVF